MTSNHDSQDLTFYKFLLKESSFSSIKKLSWSLTVICKAPSRCEMFTPLVIAFVRNAERFAIACVLLVVTLPGLVGISGNLE